MSEQPSPGTILPLPDPPGHPMRARDVDPLIAKRIG